MSNIDGTLNGFRDVDQNRYANVPQANNLNLIQITQRVSATTSGTAITGLASGTWHDVFFDGVPAAVTVDAGPSHIGYNVTLFSRGTSTSPNYVTVALFDDQDNLLEGSQTFCPGLQLAGNTGGSSGYMCTCALMLVTPGVQTTYRLRAQRNAASNSLAAVFGAPGVTGSLTDPDVESTIYSQSYFLA